MSGLDVEGLLPVPAVPAAFVDDRVVGGRLGEAPVLELVLGELAVAMPLRVRVRVLLQRRGVERVSDRDRRALAQVHRAGPAFAVRTAELRRHVSARSPRQRPPLELREIGGIPLAVVARARRAVDERGRRAEVGGSHHVAEPRQPGDREHGAGDRARNGQVRRRGLDPLALDLVLAQPGGERRSDGSGRAANRQVVVIRPGGRDPKAGGRQPPRHGRDLRGRGREAGDVLGPRDELAVVRAGRVADGPCEPVELRRVTRSEPDPRTHGVRGRHRAGQPARCRPRRLRSRELGATLAANRSSRADRRRSDEQRSTRQDADCKRKQASYARCLHLSYPL